MITKIAIAALVTISAASPAFAKDSVTKMGDSYVMHFAPFDAGNPADRARVIAGVKDTARDVCHGIGDVMDQRSCEREFTRTALERIGPTHQRVALLDTFFGRDAAGGHAAVMTLAPAH